MKRQGYLLVMVALALTFFGLLLLPYSLLSRLNAERTLRSQSSLQALYLAEAGAWEAIARLDSKNGAPGSPVLVCRTATAPCTSTSPDYVGCYTYSSSQPTDCATPTLPSGTTVTFWGFGKTKDGLVRWVKVTYDTANQAVLSWEVLP
ncbi:hypothetical protein [Thermus tengchongensis]|uniref:Uncharacterized protein n=1 Tax=Thermus tengchongensis TaxID=1214928 RepID=A0ABY2K6U7_9DEIN|nr:hypothetical protein [Thermus tengchongensis]TFU16536.1 hypothetical protein E0489_05945 [Thermus tengchongensis]